MEVPATLIQRGITALPTLGDGRQSGTSDAPSILNASPEAAVGGPIALLRDGDIVTIDARRGTIRVKLTAAELKQRRKEWKGPRETIYGSGALWGGVFVLGIAVALGYLALSIAFPDGFLLF